jgi:hypothetical protein
MEVDAQSTASDSRDKDSTAADNIRALSDIEKVCTS